MIKKLTLLLIPLAIGAYFLLNKLSGPHPQTIPVRNTPTPTVEQPVNYKATFSIVTNETTRVFTDTKYHNQSEEVYIEAENPNTITVKKRGVTWNDFFKTLPMEITKECLTTGTGQIFCSDETKKLQFYINEKEDQGALDKEINNGDSLLVKYGN